MLRLCVFECVAILGHSQCCILVYLRYPDVCLFFIYQIMASTVFLLCCRLCMRFKFVCGCVEGGLMACLLRWVAFTLRDSWE